MKKNIYFLGIGGIGMSAIAQYFKIIDCNVAGYDRTKGETCEILEKMGVKIHYEDDISLIPEIYKNPEDTLIVYTPAIPTEHVEYQWFKENNFEIKKRAEVLGIITAEKKTIAIAGAHGKTSVSTITANIFANSDFGCSAFLGGISKNFATNFIINKNSEYVIVEADEYDRSFLQLYPTTALITYIEPDHLDIYENYENLYKAFEQFATQIKPQGNLIVSENVPLKFEKKFENIKSLFTYGKNSDKNFHLSNVEYKDGKCKFAIKIQRINCPANEIHCETFLGGDHNLQNFLAAAAIADINGVSHDDIKKGIETFKGVERRFDIHIKRDDFMYIDDYAHHPQEISAFLKSVKLLYANKKITCVFQPHLYSRTKDFFEEFAESLEICDEIILLPIYPAREKPIEAVSSDMILNKIKKSGKQICEKENLIETLKNIKTDVLVTMGAGDIDRLVKPITENL